MKERFYRAVLRLFEAMPLRLRAALFEGVMLCVWAVDGRHRRIARTNLRIAFPEMGDREAARITRICYVRMGTSAAEFVEIPRMDARYVADHLRIEGLEEVRRTVEERGAAPLVMTGHFGNWEMLAHGFGTLHDPGAVVVRPLKDPILDKIVTARRELSGTRVIRKVDAAKEILKELRRKRFVGILVDQNVDRYYGVLVDFFTKKAYTTFGAARLALAARTNIHAAFIYRDPHRKFHHTLRFGPALPIDFDAPRDEEVVRLTRRCNEALEEAIRRDPTQWLWFHKRWKTRPPGEPDLYAAAT